MTLQLEPRRTQAIPMFGVNMSKKVRQVRTNHTFDGIHLNRAYTDPMVLGPHVQWFEPDALTWVWDSPRVCQCGHALEGREYRLQLELPRSWLELDLTLFCCPRCANGGLIGCFNSLELAFKRAQANGIQAELFEVEGFCLAGEWPEVYVCISEIRRPMPWQEFAVELEEAQELAEAQALRVQFGLPLIEVRSWADPPVLAS
jgi:hypothetical protein